MVRVARIAVAALVAITVAVLPLMRDRCAESCEPHAAAAPACHHATATGTHIAPASSSCGHDHNATALAAAKSTASIERAFASMAISTSRFSIESPARSDRRARPHSPPAASPCLGGRTLPLRV